MKYKEIEDDIWDKEVFQPLALKIEEFSIVQEYLAKWGIQVTQTDGILYIDHDGGETYHLDIIIYPNEDNIFWVKFDEYTLKNAWDDKYYKCLSTKGLFRLFEDRFQKLKQVDAKEFLNKEKIEERFKSLKKVINAKIKLLPKTNETNEFLENILLKCNI